MKIKMLAAFIVGVLLSTLVLYGSTRFSVLARSPEQDDHRRDPVASRKSTIGVLGSMGFLVNSVRSGSAGERAGVSPGDIVTRVNGKPFTSIGEFLAFTESEPGTEHDFSILRIDGLESKLYDLKIKTEPLNSNQ
jgi:S1-C subfamily serine protease